MRCIALALVLAAVVVNAAQADEKLPFLKVGSGLSADYYTNVTVIKVTAVDINFMHARGVGNAKLKDLSADLQKRFGYDPAKARVVLSNQFQANAQFRQTVTKPAPAAPPPREAAPEKPEKPASDDAPIIPVPNISARSFLNRPPPQFVAEKWLTPLPDPTGKFVLIDFWATWCGPCRKSIPHLNQIYAQFKNRLIVVGLSDESEADVRAMTSPKMDYSVAIDTSARMKGEVGVQGIPHALIIDPNGIVRFEGHPAYLTIDGVARLIERYGN